MAELFFRVGGLRVAVSDIRSVEQDATGQVILHLTTGAVSVSTDDGKALLEWADSHCHNPPAKKKGEK